MHIPAKKIVLLVIGLLLCFPGIALCANMNLTLYVEPQAAIDANPSFTLRRQKLNGQWETKSISHGQTVTIKAYWYWYIIVPDVNGCTKPYSTGGFWSPGYDANLTVTYTCTMGTYYRDADNDGYGDPNNFTTAASQPSGYVTNDEDCNDSDPATYLGETWYADLDGDGHSDGSAQIACTQPGGYDLLADLTSLDDCDDGDATVYPGAPEICNDGTDQDCDGTDVCGDPYYQDADQDGYGDPVTLMYAISQPTGYVTDNTDCDDNDNKEYPGQTWYADGDGDGYSDGTTSSACERPANYFVDSELTATSGDCNDSDGSINPGAAEVCEDSIDQDCNGTDSSCAADADADGTSVDGGDCDDSDATRHPGAIEIPDDGIDQDCDGSDATAADCVELADIPLDTQLSASAPNLMLGLDDSGSMDWEIMTNEDVGLYDVGGRDYEYVFADPGDNLYTSGNNSHIMKDEGKQHYWRSQWHEYNVIYYNPEVDYEPWSAALGNADPDNPRSHPYYAAHYFSLSSLFWAIDGINIPNAHYYVWSDSASKPYLVIVDSNAITYYKVDTTSATIGSGDLILDNTPPSDVTTSRTYTDERQNFANWYSYYRKRRMTAVASIAAVIPKLQGVMVGIRSINGHVIQSVLPVNVNGVDRTDEILDKIFAYHQGTHTTGSTPLRKGLQKIGKYYHVNETITPAEPELATSPLAADDTGECQQNFAVMFTDGAYNGQSPGLGNVDEDYDAPYGDSATNTLADVAMYYWEQDLAPAIDNNVPTNPFDSATWQHMVTYTVAFGVEGNLDPDDYDLDNIVVADRVYPTWPSPINSDKERIDDLWHTAVNGRGLYLNAKTPQELAQAFEDVVSDVLARIGSGASVSINGEELQDGLILYQSKYSTSRWTGDVVAYDVDPNDGSIDAANPKWSASEELDDEMIADANYWNTGRLIATYYDVSPTPAGVAFRYGDLSPAQQAVLTSADMVNYIRGNHALEEQNGGTYRDRYLEDDSGNKLRDTLLGDIVHSAPLYFNEMLFAGANDGMLHAFDSETGKELFAYVPNLSFGNLDDLTDPNYTHQYYVDLTPFARSTGSQDLLVGGLGKGGKGYYCLDITNAKTAITTETSLASKVLWEYPNATTSAAEIADMGYSYSKAFIVNTYSSYGWVVIFGNGYNSTNHDAVLFIVDAETGSLIKKINTEADATCNGLATPLAIDVNADDKVDYVYAGDLVGNMWKFDLTSDDITDWDVAYKNGATPQSLFQAKDDYGNPQPITTKPDAMFQCKSTYPGYIITFGTGRYLGNSDISDTNQQTMYAVWDYGDDSDDREFLGAFNRSASNKLSNQPASVSLLEQTVANSGTYNGVEYRVLSDNPITWLTEDDPDTPPAGVDIYGNPHSTTANHAGWYFDLPDEKERLIRDLVIRGNKVIYITSIPQSGSPCIAGGESWLMEVAACTGGTTGDTILDIDDDGEVDDDDLIPVPPPGGGGGSTQDKPPTGLQYPTMMFPPMIIDNPMDDTELKYFSTSAGNIIIMTEQDEGVGMYYWRQKENLD